MRQEIEEGDSFLCIQDFIMQDKRLAFKTGVIYTSKRDRCLTNQWGEDNHFMDQFNEFTDYFRKPDQDSKALLQRILDLKNEH